MRTQVNLTQAGNGRCATYTGRAHLEHFRCFSQKPIFLSEIGDLRRRVHVRKSHQPGPGVATWATKPFGRDSAGDVTDRPRSRPCVPPFARVAFTGVVACGPGVVWQPSDRRRHHLRLPWVAATLGEVEAVIE